MTALNRNLKTPSLYWAKKDIGTDLHGNVSYLEPEEIMTRWETNENIPRDEQGRDRVFTDVVFCDRELAEGGLLMEGTITDLDALLPPPDVAREIKEIGKSIGRRQRRMWMVRL